MMKRRAITVALTLAMVLGLPSLAHAGGQEKVTICHAAGLEGTTKYVTLTIGYPAAYGPAGHFYENGTTRAGHEQDYLGECEQPPEPELDTYRVLGSMPRYRGPKFQAERGLVCTWDVETNGVLGVFRVFCPDQPVFTGTWHAASPPKYPAVTFLRLKNKTTGDITVYTGSLHR